MRGLFCFDGPLYKDKNGVYCNVTLTDEMFSRYFCAVDELYVVVRTYSVEKDYIQLNMKPLLDQRIKVIEVENMNNIRGFLFDKPKFEKKLEEYIDEVDMIFARMPSVISNSVTKICKKKEKDYLVEVGGCAWDSFWNHGILGKIVAPIMYLQERCNVRDAEFATYVTKQFLQNRYPNVRSNVPCSNVYLAETNDIQIEKRINRIQNMDERNLVFGQAVNSIDVRYKGEHYILKAMKELKKEGIVIRYQVAGPGSGAFLKRKAQQYGVLEQLELVGTLKKDEMFMWYAQLDLYVQPSLQEGLPRSVIEAMSTGCPAVGSNIAGIPELLDSQCLFNPKNNRAVIKVLKTVMNKKTLISLALTNFERAKEYSINDIERRRKDVFMEYRKHVMQCKSKK